MRPLQLSPRAPVRSGARGPLLLAAAALAGAALALWLVVPGPATAPLSVRTANAAPGTAGLAALPAALSNGETVRVETWKRGASDAPLHSVEIASRKPTRDEVAQAERLLEILGRAGRVRLEALMQGNGFDNARQVEETLRAVHIHEAALALLREGLAFVTEAGTLVARHDDWYYGNLMVKSDGIEYRMHFPIDLRRFAQVRSSLETVGVLRQIGAEEDAKRWNGQPADVRLARVAEAARDRAEIRALRRQVSEAAAGRPAGADTRNDPVLRELQGRIEALETRHRDVPRRYDPISGLALPPRAR
ncbi:MAG: hypothetical protein IT458_08285 [Planctomycetes bacterium]|nr:hypothetical protein [Planctomycetota bacterium]